MSTLSLIGILIITIVLVYLSIKIIKSFNSEEKFTEMQTYWFVFIFFIFGGIILILSLVGFSSAMILLNKFLDTLGWILIPLFFGLVWLRQKSARLERRGEEVYKICLTMILGYNKIFLTAFIFVEYFIFSSFTKSSFIKNQQY